MQSFIYTGIGSRSTPIPICNQMSTFAANLSDRYTLRSGKAGGADEAFELGHLSKRQTNMEIYVPWRRFTNPNIPFTGCDIIGPDQEDTWLIAQQMAKSVHPNPKALSPAALALHTRNVYQVLGVDLNTPSDFVIFYADVDHYGRVKGGTATAVNIATSNNIPIYNISTDLGDDTIRQLWQRMSKE